jgi:hypothetical protein
VGHGDSVTDPTFNVLHTLRIKGLANDVAVSTATGLPLDTVIRTIDDLETMGLAGRRSGKLTGVLLTAHGYTTHVEMLAARTVSPATIQVAYDRFIEINRELKDLCTSWQIQQSDRPIEDRPDSPYDAALLDALKNVHDRAVAIVGGLAAQQARLLRYVTRLETALERIHHGDASAFVQPLSDSYHDIWMELHHDLRMMVGSYALDDGINHSAPR